MNSFVAYMKLEEVYADLPGNNENNSTMKSKDHYPMQKEKKIELVNDRFGEKIIKGFASLRPKMHS